MRLKRLTITNFRGISHLDLTLSDAQTTVLVGINGAGKSSVLDAIFIALWDEVPKRQFQPEDIRTGQSVVRIEASLQGSSISGEHIAQEVEVKATMPDPRGALQIDSKRPSPEKISVSVTTPSSAWCRSSARRLLSATLQLQRRKMASTAQYRSTTHHSLPGTRSARTSKMNESANNRPTETPSSKPYDGLWRRSSGVQQLEGASRTNAAGRSSRTEPTRREQG